MAEAGATPETTVMIGDTSYDMVMARNAGVRAVGVGWGYHEPRRTDRGGRARRGADSRATCRSIWRCA